MFDDSRVVLYYKHVAQDHDAEVGGKSVRVVNMAHMFHLKSIRVYVQCPPPHVQQVSSSSFYDRDLPEHD